MNCICMTKRKILALCPAKKSYQSSMNSLILQGNYLNVGSAAVVVVNFNDGGGLSKLRTSLKMFGLTDIDGQFIGILEYNMPGKSNRRFHVYSRIHL